MICRVVKFVEFGAARWPIMLFGSAHVSEGRALHILDLFSNWYYSMVFPLPVCTE